MDLRDEVISRLREVETQLSALNRYTLLHEPKMPQLLAEDVRKVREGVEELLKA